MNPFLKTEYLTFLYEHMQQAGYLPIKYRSISYLPDTLHITHTLHIIHKDTVMNKGENFPKVSSLKEFLELGVKQIPTVIIRNTTVEDTFIQDYFVKYFHENPLKQKDLLKFTKELSGVFLNSHYVDLFPKLFKDKKALISALNSLPSKSFNLHGTEAIEKFHDFLKSFKLTDNEIKDTFFSYYNQRQSFLKDPSYATTSKNFLLSLYGNNNKGIDKYFSFMPFLKNEFSEINNEKDIFKKKDAFELISEVNIKTMLKTFSLDYYTLDRYESLLRVFTVAYATEMKSKNVDIYKIEKNKDSIRIVISHNNPELTKELFEEKILNLLHFLKDNASYPINDDSMKKWIMHSNISESLPEKKTSTSSIKI